MSFDDLIEWLRLYVEGYTFSIAPWIETGMDRQTAYCVIAGSGGPRPDVEDRRKNYNIFLLGPQDAQEYAQQLEIDAEKIMQGVMLGEVLPCGAAIIAAIGEPAGPGLTTENRSWVQITLQITF